MVFPPWILAAGILLLVCAWGAYVIKSVHIFPEGFTDASGNAAEASAPAPEAVKKEGLTDATPAAPDYKPLEMVQKILSNPQLMQQLTKDLATHAEYKSLQMPLKPHQSPEVRTPALTAVEPFTDGPSVELAPSVRQQIRQDIKKAVEDEIQQIQNEYEIKYVPA